MIAGMRAGWLTMALVLGTYMALMLKRENRELRRTVLTIPVLAVIVLAVSYFASPLFQERVDVTRAFTTGADRRNVQLVVQIPAAQQSGGRQGYRPSRRCSRHQKA